MKSLSAIFALPSIGLAALPARAEISTETARASVAPFYKALNAEFAERQRRADPAGDGGGLGVLPRQR